MKYGKLILAVVAFALMPVFGYAEIQGRWEQLVPKIPPAENSLDVVTIHEVFSFGCPHCYTFNEHAHKLKKKFGKKIKIVPLPIGWMGLDPGRLYFIAEKYGKGEAVKDMIFDFYHQKGLERQIYERDKLQYVARFNGLTEQFKKEMDSKEIIKKMEASIAFAKEYEINSTPTIIVEKSMKASGDFKNLVKIINSLLKEPVK